MDLAFSILGLILTAPALGAAAAGIWIRMGRPVLFRQKRAGLNGATFVLYKLRTMNSACDAAGRLLPDAQRVTPWGQMLRRTSVDELPQLWNVLKGEMALVGPRPLFPEYVTRYSSRERRRLETKPGITGWAQVNGRNAIEWARKFELDVWYVDHWSLALDCRILWLTIARVWSGIGVSEADRATVAEFMGSGGAGASGSNG
jgi:lipopolysaccharide/colanic/teichoic acid biosynthesis glycosyltransferase